MTTNEKAAENIQGGVLIRVADLHKSFGKLDVLKGIDTEIRRGEVLVVIGPSGSGKSTRRDLRHHRLLRGGQVHPGPVYQPAGKAHQRQYLF